MSEDFFQGISKNIIVQILVGTTSKQISFAIYSSENKFKIFIYWTMKSSLKSILTYFNIVSYLHYYFIILFSNKFKLHIMLFGDTSNKSGLFQSP